MPRIPPKWYANSTIFYPTTLGDCEIISTSFGCKISSDIEILSTLTLGSYSLYAEQILNKIANTFDGTYAGLKSMLQRFRKYFFWNPALKGVESTS